MPLPSTLLKIPKIARPYKTLIEKGINDGLSSRAIHRSLVNSGINIGRTSVLGSVNAIKEKMRADHRLKYLNRNSRPNINRLHYSSRPMARNFSAIVKIKGIQAETGKAILQHIHISSDALLTRAEIEQHAIDLINDGDEYLIDNVEAQLQSMLVSSHYG